MPTQDKDTKMAIPSEPKNLARKIMNTDLSAYAMGKAAKEGIKKFVAKHPVVVTDYPADDAESNNARFKGDKVKKDDATRKADYKTGEDEKAYESVIKRKLIERFVAKISNAKLAQKETEGLDTSEPAKKMAVVSTNKPIVSRVSDIGAGRKEYNVKVVKSNEETIAEGGDPMSASPATSDNPGWSGESTSSGDEGSKEKEKTSDPDEEGDEENDETETVKEVREYLENIAMMSAEMFENLQDDAELDKWVVEKLELAHDFIEAVSKEINDSKGNVDDEEDEEEGNQGGKDDNNNAKPSAFKGNGEQSMAKEEVEGGIHINPEKKGMFNGKNKSELTKQYNNLKASGPHKKGSPSFTKMKELEFAIRAKSGWGKVDEVRDVEQVDEKLETETIKHPKGERPKGIGWVLKSAGEQTGKDHSVWERKFKRVGGVKEEVELDEATADIHPEANKAMKPYRVHLKKHGYKVQHQGAASELHVHPSGHSVRLYHMPGNGEELIHNVTFMNAQKGRMAEPIGSAEHLAHKLKVVHHFGEATVPAPSEDDEGYYTHKEIHGKNAVSKEDWKKGIRKPKAPVKESALGDALGSEEGVKKIAPKKDEYGNEVKHPARSLARKAMKKFSTKKGA